MKLYLTSRTGPCHGLVHSTSRQQREDVDATCLNPPKVPPSSPPLTKPTAPALHSPRLSRQVLVLRRRHRSLDSIRKCRLNLLPFFNRRPRVWTQLRRPYILPLSKTFAPFSFQHPSCCLPASALSLELVFSSHLTSFHLLNSLHLHQPSMRF